MKSGRKGFSYIKSLRFFFRRPLAIEKKKGLKERVGRRRRNSSVSNNSIYMFSAQVCSILYY